MAGIYVHIPFCRQACHYCDFHFSVSLKGQEAFWRALDRELEMRCRFFGEAKPRTLYLGGGTPSLVSVADLERLLDGIRAAFPGCALEEITLEANPEDVSPERVRQWMEMGINRVSLGVQSLLPEFLSSMNRSHNAAQSLHALDHLFGKGMENISIDLIYHHPGLTPEGLEEQVLRLMQWPLVHVSAYQLTVEPGTFLGRETQSGRFLPSPDEESWAQHRALCASLARFGILPYETSNFSKPGWESRHNSSYWFGAPYLGLGPSAHSFDGAATRMWNPRSTGAWAQALGKGTLPLQAETLSMYDRHNEYLMTRLRLTKGFTWADYAGQFGGEAMGRLRHAWASWHQKGCIALTEEGACLTPEGRLWADGIASDGFWLA